MQAVLSGDIEQFELIIHACQQDVWRIVAAARLDHATANDLIQETFVQAYRKLEQYKPGTNFSFWLKAIARNMVRKKLRSLKSRSRILSLYQQHVAQQYATKGAESVYDGQYRDALGNCVQRLPARSQDILQRHYGSGQSLTEIGEAIGSTMTAVKQLIFRVRQSLRTCIELRMEQQ